jgi:hypothetical protein
MSKLKHAKQFMPLEKIGLFLSFACAIHCLAMPFVLFFAPYFIGSYAFGPSVEWALAGSSFLLAAYLLIADYLKHRKIRPLLFLGIAFIIKLIDLFVGHQSDEWIYGTLLGISVAYAYWVNYQHKSACTCKVKS